MDSRLVARTPAVVVAGLLGLGMVGACGARSQKADASATAGSMSSGGWGVSGSPVGGTAGSSSGSGAGSGGVGSAAGGTGPAAGVGGTSREGGNGGVSDSGGQGGNAGVGGAAAPHFPECRVDADCAVADDCCDCRAVPRVSASAMCKRACDQDACEARGITPTAKCTLGRCTLAVSCDARLALCDSPTPQCAAGQVASVTSNGCWGPCVDTTQCSGVTRCEDCAENERCVTFPNVGGIIYRCIERHSACTEDNLCACLAPCGDYLCAQRGGELSCVCAGC
jgi:hypothetical protein